MVKPIFPSQPPYDTAQSRHPTGIANIIGEDGAGAVGSLPANDDVLFPSIENFASLLERDVLHSPSSYNTFNHTAPRERVLSVPDDEDGLASLPRQRRNSAPVEFAGAGNAPASTSHQENSSSMSPALRDIATNGQELFWFILSEEVKNREATEPGRLNALTISPSSRRMEVMNERGRFGGRTLRQIAEAFSHTPLRMRVRDHAESVHLQSLNYNSFSDLLFGLFQEGGVTQARVLVLFFFCADVALRALRENLTKHFQLLVDWTSRYITEKLSAWVLDHGGWAAVLQESVDQVYKVAVVGMCLLTIVALSTMMWKHR